MVSSVKDFIVILQSFLPAALPIRHSLNAISAVESILPLVSMHQNQRREPRQPAQTGWFKSAVSVISSAFDAENTPELQYLVSPDTRGVVPAETWLARSILFDIDIVYEFLDIDLEAHTAGTFFPTPPAILISSRRNCAVCPGNNTFEPHSLRRKDQPQKVRLLNKDYKWREALLFVAHCPKCSSDYYPDRYTFNHNDRREQKLEFDAQYLRASMSGIWVHRSIATAQERAIFRFHCGWSSFASWLNGILGSDQQHITNRQSQRLFLEHTARRLLSAHGKAANFTCKANPTSALLASSIRDQIGRDGGSIPSSLHHGCTECTHKKRYRADAVAEGANAQGEAHGVVGVVAPLNDIPLIDPPFAGPVNPVLNVLQPPVQELNAPVNQPRGHVRMAVMDGKTIGHRICALTTCNKPLVNYKNGRFCADHLPLQSICGIIPCPHPVSSNASVTCDKPDHADWYKQYRQRFGRLNYPGVRRVMRQQQEDGAVGGLHVHQQLPSLQLAPDEEPTPGGEIVHTFRAQSVHCIETVQWACGVPVGWGKCYRSESEPQVLSILNRLWEDNDALRPSFVAFDDACNLLRHIVTQDQDDPWLKSTKFIVDAFHYIGHRATDILCRLWCNPAPTNGSQPDLVVTATDDGGQVHLIRAFNTETAEQLNSWLDGFESQLTQMSAVNFDVFMHFLMLLYKEDVEKKIQKDDMMLPDDFWDE